MGRRREDRLDAEERTAARDFVMARLAACRAYVAAVSMELDTCLGLFVDPEDDTKGKDRADLLEQIDDDLGAAVIALHAAQEVWEDVDPAEGEPEAEEVEEDDDEGDDKEER